MKAADLTPREREIVALLLQENVAGYVRMKGGKLGAADRRAFARVLLHSSLMFDSRARRRLNGLRAKLLHVPKEECQ